MQVNVFHNAAGRFEVYREIPMVFMWNPIRLISEYTSDYILLIYPKFPLNNGNLGYEKRNR